MKKLILIALAFFIPCLSCEITKKVGEFIEKEIEIIETIVAPRVEENVHGELPAIAHNIHKNRPAFICRDNCISAQEKEYIQKRMAIVRASLEKRLRHTTMQEKRTPIIACVFSGGGYRSMLCTLGSLKGLKKERLFDCITYAVGLSGSTWALGSWFSSQMSLHKFVRYIQNCIQKPLYEITQDERLLLAQMIAVKELSQQPLTLVDIYGGLLGNRLLAYMKEKCHTTYLSEQQEALKDGTLPYPIYTAVSGNREDDTAWYTFTPHRVTNITYGASIPTFGCGRMYDNTQSTNHVPELPLSVLLGTWGSAFAATWERIIEEVEENAVAYKKELEELKELLKPIDKSRPIPCELELPNFLKGLNTPLSSQENLQIVDGGLNINLPYPAVSGICPERKADIILFFDNSAGNLGEELQKCTQYAEHNCLHFPPISTDGIDSKTMSIFREDNPHTPLVIYLPAISNQELWEEHKQDPRFEKYALSDFDLKKETDEGFCQTYRFRYSKKHSRLVLRQTEFNLRINADRIKEAISWKIDAMTHM